MILAIFGGLRQTDEMLRRADQRERDLGEIWEILAILIDAFKSDNTGYHMSSNEIVIPFIVDPPRLEKTDPDIECSSSFCPVTNSPLTWRRPALTKFLQILASQTGF